MKLRLLSIFILTTFLFVSPNRICFAKPPSRHTEEVSSLQLEFEVDGGRDVTQEENDILVKRRIKVLEGRGDEVSEYIRKVRSVLADPSFKRQLLRMGVDKQMGRHGLSPGSWVVTLAPYCTNADGSDSFDYSVSNCRVRLKFGSNAGYEMINPQSREELGGQTEKDVRHNLMGLIISRVQESARSFDQDELDTIKHNVNRLNGERVVLQRDQEMEIPACIAGQESANNIIKSGNAILEIHKRLIADQKALETVAKEEGIDLEKW